MQVVCAGSLDTFQVYVWSVRTGRLLDVLAGHEGPVAGLAFSPTQSLLASASWDKTVRTWDVFRCHATLHYAMSCPPSIARSLLAGLVSLSLQCSLSNTNLERPTDTVHMGYMAKQALHRLLYAVYQSRHDPGCSHMVK